MATHMSDNQIERIYKQLDTITETMQNVQRDLHSVVRLQEQVSNHTETLKRFGTNIEEVRVRVHNVELWQAERSNNDYFDIMLAGVSEKINGLEKKIDKLETTNNTQNEKISNNHFSITKSALGWTTGILSALIVGIILYSYKGE
jgi:archaellum component FlaC